MAIFVSAHSLRAISKYYARQEHSSRDKLSHLANRLRTFILAKLHHVLFALYFAAPALRRPASDASVEDIYVCVSGDSESGVSECTPLLAAAVGPTHAAGLTKDCINWRSVGLLAMCTTALALAAYLLWLQTRLPDFGYRLTLIEHDIWSDMDLRDRAALLDPLQVASVFFTHTDSPECREDCIGLLHELQVSETFTKTERTPRIIPHNPQESRREELPYNFLITGDCQAFEARGWQYESSLSRELTPSTSLVVAFVGSFDSVPPSVCQLQAAQALLMESLKRRKLRPDYRLYVVGKDAAAVLRELKLWPEYAGHRGIE
ncbi:hypothetical protein KR018_010815 [Drosophila ironensis]|nr:hypothetical protein KR018_010815 [Drosophila ironensis]